MNTYQLHDACLPFFSAIRSKPWDKALYLILADFVEEHDHEDIATKIRDIDSTSILESMIERRYEALERRTEWGIVYIQEVSPIAWGQSCLYAIDEAFDIIPF